MAAAAGAGVLAAANGGVANRRGISISGGGMAWRQRGSGASGNGVAAWRQEWTAYRTGAAGAVYDVEMAWRRGRGAAAKCAENQA